MLKKYTRIFILVIIMTSANNVFSKEVFSSGSLLEDVFYESNTDTLKKYIKEQSINGKLDFKKELEKETQPFFLQDGIAYNKKDYAIYLWGKTVKGIGIKKIDEAQELYQEIYKIELTNPEKNALKNGFNKEE